MPRSELSHPGRKHPGIIEVPQGTGACEGLRDRRCRYAEGLEPLLHLRCRAIAGPHPPHHAVERFRFCRCSCCVTRHVCTR